jgi:hypothetical protein
MLLAGTSYTQAPQRKQLSPGCSMCGCIQLVVSSCLVSVSAAGVPLYLCRLGPWQLQASAKQEYRPSRPDCWRLLSAAPPPAAVSRSLQLLSHPEVSRLFPSDVIERARVFLAEIPGGLGAYSDSAGALVLRKQIAAALEQRDGCPASPDELYLTVSWGACVRGRLRSKMLTTTQQQVLCAAAAAAWRLQLCC